MALTQKNAHYPYRDHIKDEYLRDINDVHANRIAAILEQGNYGADGPPAPPSAPSQLNIVAGSGVLTATVVHKNTPPGTQYVLQYSTSPNFEPGTVISETLSSISAEIPTTWQKSLTGFKGYLRIAPRFPSSALGAWVYHGSSANPTQVST